MVDGATGNSYNKHTYRHVFADVRAAAIAGVVDVAATEAARAGGRNDPEPVWHVAPCPSLTGKRDQDFRDTAVTWLARAGATRPEIADAAIDKLVTWMEKLGMAV